MKTRKKPRKTSKNVKGMTSCRLPRDLLMRIAQWIPESADFFKFVEAFKDTTGQQDLQDLQDLDHFRKLGHVGRMLPRASLWPPTCLQLLPEHRLEAAYKGCMKYYKCIRCSCAMEISWLKNYVEKYQEVHVDDGLQREYEHQYPIEDFFLNLQDLPATKLLWTLSVVDGKNFARVCSLSMKHLQVLHLSLANANSASSTCLFESISKSSIGDLHLINASVSVTSLAYLGSWLSSGNAKSLTMIKWNMPTEQPAMMKFYQAVFTSVSLENLSVNDTKLLWFESFVFSSPVGIKTLDMDAGSLPPGSLTTLSAGLAMSSVEKIVLRENVNNRNLFASPISSLSTCSNLQHVDVQGHKMGDLQCERLLCSLFSSSICHLDLSGNLLSNRSLDVITTNLAKFFPHLRELLFRRNRLACTESSFRIIEAFHQVHPHPHSQANWFVDLSDNKFSDTEVKTLTKNLSRAFEHLVIKSSVTPFPMMDKRRRVELVVSSAAS